MSPSYQITSMSLHPTQDHPFQHLFETFGRLPASHAEAVNKAAQEKMMEVLSVPLEAKGRCILLRAPRAGHGKTHLLSRIQHQLGASYEFIPLYAHAGAKVDALSVIEDAVKRLVRPLPAAGGLAMLDLVARRLFAYSLQPLVASGEVPCHDREAATLALRARPTETFDFHHPNAVTAHWARENFEILGPRLSMELSQRSGAPIREVAFWVNALFRFATTPSDHPARAGTLEFEVTGNPVSNAAATERLSALLSLLSLLTRVVLVADDLEGFSADEAAALRFAAFIGGIRHSAERVDIIVSLNQDIWDNAFVPRLSGGLTDRLSEIVIELTPLDDDEIVSLYDSRAPGLGRNIFERADLSERHARGLIRAAGIAWEQASGSSEPPPVVEDDEPAKMEAALEVEAARELVENAPPEPIVPGPVHQDEPPGRRQAAGSDAPQVRPSPFHAPKPAREDVAEHFRYGSPPFQGNDPSHDFGAPHDPPPREKEEDRVVDLLKQFRERYGR